MHLYALLKVPKKTKHKRSKGVTMTKRSKTAFFLLISFLITLLISLPIYADPAEESASLKGDDITLALLIVSGLLAVASFIAFLISLSSVRRIPSKKDKE